MTTPAFRSNDRVVVTTNYRDFSDPLTIRNAAGTLVAPAPFRDMYLNPVGRRFPRDAFGTITFPPIAIGAIIRAAPAQALSRKTALTNVAASIGDLAYLPVRGADGGYYSEAIDPAIPLWLVRIPMVAGTPGVGFAPGSLADIVYPESELHMLNAAENGYAVSDVQRFDA